MEVTFRRAKELNGRAYGVGDPIDERLAGDVDLLRTLYRRGDINVKGTGSTRVTSAGRVRAQWSTGTEGREEAAPQEAPKDD